MSPAAAIARPDGLPRAPSVRRTTIEEGTAAMTHPQETSYRVAGLKAEAQIHVDRWGVPHIRAQSRDDAFLVQGFNAARDRLWQLDLWRKRGLGLLAGDFGPGYFAQDRAARLFLYRGDMAAEWDAYGVPGLRGIVERFVAGINAYIA